MDLDFAPDPGPAHTFVEVVVSIRIGASLVVRESDGRFEQRTKAPSAKIQQAVAGSIVGIRMPNL
jgi:hypothetical protein